jgi:hypothetical protein
MEPCSYAVTEFTGTCAVLSYDASQRSMRNMFEEWG